MIGWLLSGPVVMPQQTNLCAMAKMIVCSECGEERKSRARGLCNPCYRLASLGPAPICSECGRATRKPKDGLCTTCHNRKQPPRLIECQNCREAKPHAARRLCESCYKRLIRNARVKERTRARLEHELRDKRCKTCSRLLRIVRNDLNPRPIYCDMFCRHHCPERRAKLNIQADGRTRSDGVAAPQSRGVVTY